MPRQVMTNFMGENADRSPIAMGDIFNVGDQLWVIENYALPFHHQRSGVIDVGAVEVKVLRKSRVGEDLGDNVQCCLRRLMQDKLIGVKGFVASTITGRAGRLLG